MRQHRGANVIFQGQIAVIKRLQSVRLPDGARIVVCKVGCYQSRIGHIGEATTDHGKRWVSYSAEFGWVISKTPPRRRRHQEQG